MTEIEVKAGEYVIAKTVVKETAIYPIDVVSKLYVENEMLKRIADTILNDERVPEEYKEFIIEYIGKEWFLLGDKPWCWKGVL